MAKSTDKHRFLTLKVTEPAKKRTKTRGKISQTESKGRRTLIAPNNLKQKSPNFPLVGNKIAQTSQVGNLKVTIHTQGSRKERERKRAKLPPQLIMPTTIPKYRCFYPYVREPQQLFV